MKKNEHVHPLGTDKTVFTQTHRNRGEKNMCMWGWNKNPFVTPECLLKCILMSTSQALARNIFL